MIAAITSLAVIMAAILTYAFMGLRKPADPIPPHEEI
jgi:hypothetical protein